MKIMISEKDDVAGDDLVHHWVSETVYPRASTEQEGDERDPLDCGTC